MDVHTSEQRRRNMQAIRSKDTKMELALGKALWSAGLRYRKNNSKVFGKPDFTFKKFKVAVFVDSEYFHGKDWDRSKLRIKTNRKFWWNKIESNIKRDQEVNKILKKDGWKVIRFWSTDVKRNLSRCCKKISQSIELRKNVN